MTSHSEEGYRVTTPVYRVNFWERPAADLAWNLDAHILVDAPDVAAVLAWAANHADGRRYEILVEADGDTEIADPHAPRRSPLVRLLGVNPNE